MGVKHHCAFVECLAAGSHDPSVIHLLLGVILECHRVALSQFLQSIAPRNNGLSLIFPFPQPLGQRCQGGCCHCQPVYLPLV